MERLLWMLIAVLYAGVVAWIAIDAPRQESLRMLGWMAAIGAGAGVAGLLCSIVLSQIEHSKRLAEATRRRAERAVNFIGRVTFAGFSAALGAQGPVLIIQGSVLWGLVMLGSFAVIVVLCILAPSEV